MGLGVVWQWAADTGVSNGDEMVDKVECEAGDDRLEQLYDDKRRYTVYQCNAAEILTTCCH